MTEDEFLEYVSKLWSMLIWGNKKYVVDKLIADNGFTALKKQLAELLYGTNPIEKRWDLFLKSVKGWGLRQSVNFLHTLILKNMQSLIRQRFFVLGTWTFLICQSTITSTRERNIWKFVPLQKKLPKN